jgi:hypothetical protein
MADYKAGGLTLSIEAIANDAVKSLDAVIERLSLIDKGLGGIKGSSYIRKSAKTPKSNGGAFGFAKLGVNLYMMRRLGRFMGNLVQAGSDYNETLNLWQVAMRNNLDVADQFINKMQKAYGISTKTLMNAQAVFKNMIGSLGQISDATAYALSEALVQMSADFASLYNVTIESAFQKMQSMLAGQVRPIRSAGLDMTETTLFMFYQELGGTKTMRQLNRTEKQLLSILAVYQQMGSAGALGDMTKTLNQFANQSRMMTEYWQELKTWSGLLLKDLIDQSGALIYINALLITTTEIIKAIAKSRGIGDENFLTGMFETAEATNDAVDELQGKLLDFDKFRSLEGASASPLAIDEKLLQAISGYSSKIDQAQNAAQKLADTWLEFWLTDEGTLTKNAERVLDILEGLVKFTTILIGLKIGGWLLGFVKGITSLTVASKGLNTVLVAGVIYVICEAIDAFREGDKVTGWLAVAIGTTLVGALVALKFATTDFGLSWKTVFLGVTPHILGMVAGIGVLVAGIYSLSNAWGDMAGWHKALTIIGAVTAALIGAWVAIKSFSLSVPVALGIGAALAGGVLLISSQFKTKSAEIPNYEMGASDIDSGTVFRAGEFGKTEAVYTGSNGKTNVANVRQMEQAFYNALSRHSREGNGTIVVQAYLDGEKVYENTTARAKSRGYVWAKV